MRIWTLAIMVLALTACVKGSAPEPGMPAEGVACGGGAACGAGEYCAYPQTGFCGAAGQAGICLPRPEACTMDYSPVCGCDAMTYTNACMAAAAGVSVAQVGECP